MRIADKIMLSSITAVFTSMLVVAPVDAVGFKEEGSPPARTGKGGSVGGDVDVRPSAKTKQINPELHRPPSAGKEQSEADTARERKSPGKTKYEP